MEIKKNPSIDGEKNKKQAAALNIKINGFLINYFNHLIFSLSIVILAAGLFMLAYPKYQQISEENEEVKNKLQIEYEAKLNYLNSIRNLKKAYRSISDEEKAKIAAMVPAENDTSVIITEIESIAVRNSALLNAVKIEPQSVGGRTSLKVESAENKKPLAGIFNEPPPGVGLVTIEVKLSSVNYPILKNIIKSFENNLRLFDIAKVNFSVKENKALLNIYSYYLLP